MLAKLALRNVRRSLKDFAVYFVTLVLGVSVFYAFNSLGEQQLLFDMEASGNSYWGLTQELMGVFSVAVAFVLGFLVIYANNFLLRRRKHEFGTYLLLGMSARQVSFIILLETLIVGIGALVVGLAFGFVLSQGMAFFSAGMLGMVMKDYHFLFSMQALVFTAIAFAIIFVVVGVFNVVQMRRQKLVDLISSHSRSDAYKARPLALCIAVFVASIAILAAAYKTLVDNGLLDISLGGSFGLATTLMLIGTLLFFWSVAGFVMALVQRLRKMYFKGVAMFTLRQVASRVNAACATLWAVCVILFFAITTFLCGMGLANIFSSNIEESTQYDATVEVIGTFWDTPTHKLVSPDGGSKASYYEKTKMFYKDPVAAVKKKLPNWDRDVAQAASIKVWATGFTYADLAKRIRMKLDDEQSMGFPSPVTVVSQSEFNVLREMCGRDEVQVGDDGYAVVNTVETSRELAEKTASFTGKLSIAGCKLRSSGKDVIRQGIHDSMGNSETCILVVPDAVTAKIAAKTKLPMSVYININAIEGAKDTLLSSFDGVGDNIAYGHDTAQEILSESIGFRFMVTYLAIYIGFALLVSTAAILAIQQLSFASDSIARYRTLAQLGASRRQIMGSLRTQTLVYFLVPLGLACCHWACAFYVLQTGLFTLFGVSAFGQVTFAALLILVVYGVYMLVAYFGARSVIKASISKRLLQ